jgi:hypothetical protein
VLCQETRFTSGNRSYAVLVLDEREIAKEITDTDYSLEVGQCPAIS